MTSGMGGVDLSSMIVGIILCVEEREMRPSGTDRISHIRDVGAPDNSSQEYFFKPRALRA